MARKKEARVGVEKNKFSFFFFVTPFNESRAKSHEKFIIFEFFLIPMLPYFHDDIPSRSLFFHDIMIFRCSAESARS